jgi:hypothetical protein
MRGTERGWLMLGADVRVGLLNTDDTDLTGQVYDAELRLRRILTG